MHFTNPKFQAFDGNGAPLSGGKLYTYTSGGSTAKTTYSNRACTSANDNPVVLDSRGECVVYGKGGYKFVLKNSDGVTIWTFDDILMSSESLWDADRDTGVQVEESSDEDKIRFDTGGTQRGLIDAVGFQETVSATNYKLANFRELWGSLQRSQFVWGDATSLLIEPGAYWCKEKFCSWAVQLNKTVSTLTSGEIYYVYLDYSAIISGTAIVAGNLLYVVTEPAWNDTYRGWYNGDDKCIFGFYADGSNTMDEFFHDGDLVLYADPVADVASQDVDNTWEDAGSALTIPVFTRRAYATMRATRGDQASNAGYWKTKGQTGTTGHLIGSIFTAATEAANTCQVITDSNHLLELKMTTTGTDTISVDTEGWFFPIGL